jgi:hypothetical protein
MGTAAKSTHENRTITVDFQNETTYFQLLGDGKAFVECVLAFLLSLGFQLKHQATCRGGGCLTRHSHYVRVRLGRITIWRLQCTRCKAVFTILPHFVLRYRQMRPAVARDALLAMHGGLTDFPHLPLRFESFLYSPRRSFTISSPLEETVMPNQPTYHSQVLDHLGLVAGMFDELGIGDVIDQATRQNPEMRDRTVGEAVKAMVLNGLGCINQALYLVPRFFQHKPTYRLMSPRVTPEQLNDDALGRALDTL